MKHQMHTSETPQFHSLLAIAIPHEFGGLGKSWSHFVAAFSEAAAKADLGWMIGLAGQAWVVKALLDHGSAQQQAHWLPKMCDGALAATALAEPQSGSDMANVQTQLHAIGDRWLLTGQKRNISFGMEAECILVLCKTVEDGAFRLVLLDETAQPWSATPSPAKIGLASLPTADLAFENISVSKEDILAPDNNALATFADFMTFGRALLALGVSAILDHHLQIVLQFAATRHAGNQAIDERQYVQLKLTNAKMRIVQTQVLAERSLQAHLVGEHTAVGLGSMAKLAATEALLLCSRDFASILGTEGFQEGPISKLAVDALAFQAVGGTEEVHRINLFRQMKAGKI